MATFSWKNATSGSWVDDAVWAGGVVPNDAQADVSLAASGAYTVTVPAGGSFATRSVTGAAGVTLDIAGALSISASSPLSAVIIEAGGVLSGGGTVKVGTTLANAGLLSATIPGTLLAVQNGTMTNTGTLAAAGTGTYLWLFNAALTNLAGGVLTGGTYEATGEVLGGSSATIDFARAGISTEIATLNATVTLRFVNSTLQTRSAAGVVRTLETTLTAIGAAGTLRLLEERSYTTSQALSVAGRLVLDGGTLSVGGGLSVAAGGMLEGFGIVSSPAALAGTLHAAGGTLSLAGGLSGSGVVSIDSDAAVLLPGGSYDAGFGGTGVLHATSGNVALTAPLSGGLTLLVDAPATLDIGAAGGSLLVFAAAGGSLSFNVGSGFTGRIAGFQTGNVLEVKDVLATGASVAANGADSTLTLATAGGTVTLALAGDYSGKTFAVASDGKGGTNVTVAGVSFAPEPGVWASPALTWSFATSNYALAPASFSSFVDPVAQAGLAALWRAAFARWAEVSSLTLTEVADTPSAEGQADIRVGWGDFGNPPIGEIGNALYSYLNSTKKFVPGTLVRLQDPAITPLADSAGTLLYQDTVSSAYQVMLHEIGHALGLDHAATATDPNAVMTPVASAANRDLDISDIAGIQALYAAIVPPPAASFSIAALAAERPEGNAGDVTAFTFTVTRSGSAAGVASVPYSVTGGALRPALAADFVGGALPSGSVGFAAGETSRVLSLAVAGNTIPQGNRDFTVILGAPPAGSTLGTARAGGTIEEDEPIGDIAVINGTTGQPVAITPTYYTGPVAGIEREFVLLTPDNLTIAVAGANWFIHSGSGDDAIAAAGGTNVLDGGTGSNFLTGATGFDTFFVDARGATAPIWSTVNDFGKGDATTLWGISEGTHTLDWVDDEGAEGFKGLTLHASAPGLPTASLTLPGYDLAGKGAKLTVLFGFDPGSSSDYMYVLAN